MMDFVSATVICTPCLHVDLTVRTRCLMGGFAGSLKAVGAAAFFA